MFGRTAIADVGPARATVVVHLAAGAGWVITEQVRTVAVTRFRRYAPEITLSADEADEVRHVLGQMLNL